MREYTDFIDQFQEDTLSAIKTAQDTSFRAFAAMREYAPENMTTATELISKSFDFASKVIELQKDYAIKAAEYIATASKKASATKK